MVEAKPHWNWVAWANLEKSKRLFSGYFKQHIWYERESFEGEARRWQSLIIWTRTDPWVCVCVFVSTEAPGDFLTYSGVNQATFPCVSEFVFLWFLKVKFEYECVFQYVVDDAILAI